MQLVDWLKNLTVRFLINLPHSELTSVSRVCFQIEEAQWYYEDFVRPLEAASGNNLPHLTLKEFCLLIFKNCPLTSCFTEEQHIAAYETFLAYKVRVPVRGAILLDESMERAVLVRGWKKGANWSFPRGKINKDEKDLTCAIREVYEETGFDIRAAGLVPQDEDQAKYIDVTMREQHMRLFVFRNVPLDTHFEPRTRKEISKIDWYNLRDLPGYTKKHKGAQSDPAHEALQANKFYMVAPFLGPLKKWIAQQRRLDIGAPATEAQAVESDFALIEEPTQASDGRSEELRALLNIGTATPAKQVGLPPIQHFTQNNTGSPQVRPQPQAVFTQQAAHFEHQFTHGNASNQHPSTQSAQQGPPRISSGPPATYSYGPPPGIQHLPNGIPQHLQGLLPFQQQHIPAAYPPSNGVLTSSGFQASQFHQQGHRQQVGQTPQSQMRGFQQELGHQPYPQHQQQPFARSQAIHTSHDEPSAMLAAPKASELPAPKLNAHSMRLLQAFKQDATQSGSAVAPQLAQQANAHQSKLLDLFRSPSQAAPEISAPETQQPVMSVPPVRPTVSQERRPTLNEITRTLPSKARRSSQQSSHTPVPTEAYASKHHSSDAAQMQHQHRTNDKEYQRDSSHASKAERANGQPPQSTQAAKRTASPVVRQPHTANGGTIKKHTKAKVTQETAKPPSFTILARPSSKESPITTPASSQPQLLKRTSEEDTRNGLAHNAAKGPEQNKLLALFGGASSPAPAKPSLPASPQGSASLDTGKPITILRHSTPLAETTPTTLQAPSATPESSSAKSATTPQTNLLSLFKNNAAASPGTPISPFALGSPTVARQPQTLRAFPTAEKKLDGTVERKASASAASDEAKGFLLGFLNGVVQKEGRST